MILSYLKQCYEVAKQLTLRMEQLMADAQEFRNELLAITNDLDRIADLVKGAAEEGMSLAEEQEVLDLVKNVRAKTASVKLDTEPPAEGAPRRGRIE